MSDRVQILVDEDGSREVWIAGVDVTRFVRALGLDMEVGAPPRFVIEGGGRLEAVLDGQEIIYRRIPLLSAEDRRLLKAAVERCRGGPVNRSVHVHGGDEGARVDLTGLGERLETIRDKAGLSLRDFWRRLVGGEEGSEAFNWHEDGAPGRPAVVYTTLRRYHRGEREAPVGYLVRVAEKFGVRIEWLATGRGPRNREVAGEEVGRLARVVELLLETCGPKREGASPPSEAP